MHTQEVMQEVMQEVIAHHASLCHYRLLEWTLRALVAFESLKYILYSQSIWPPIHYTYRSCWAMETQAKKLLVYSCADCKASRVSRAFEVCMPWWFQMLPLTVD